MTPKEKAFALINSFVPMCSNNTDDRFVFAKQCALIAADAGLFAVTEFANYEGEAYHFVTYWDEVKTEIQSL